MRLAWRQGKEAPVAMGLNRGTAVVHNNTAYFSQYSTVHLYAIPEDEWSSIGSDQEFFGLAIVNDKLTTIGGSVDENFAINTLLCLSESLEWEALLPSMRLARIRPAAVTTPTHLVVAGGWTNQSHAQYRGLSTVEVLNLHTLQWASAGALPIAMKYPSMILCNEHVYLSENGIFSRSPVEKLVNSTISSASNSVWTRLPDTPTWHTTLATLRGRVLTIGGSDDEYCPTPTGTIHCYDRSTKSWSIVGEMPTPRFHNLVAVLSSNELVVVGDCTATEIAHAY